MKVRVQLFAVARELAGQPAVELTLPEGATVGDLRTQLATVYPTLAELARRAAFAVDADYADDTTHLPADVEVACIPPVSGG